MKAAVLGNGKSRFLYTTPSKYDYVIGCNIPWTVVNAIVISDERVIDYWGSVKVDKPNTNFILSERAWKQLEESQYKNTVNVIDVLSVLDGAETSAHIAVKYLISKGYTDIDVYGCDSRFSDDIKSRTDSYIHKQNHSKDIVRIWNTCWDNIINQNSSVEIKFINESSCTL